MKEFFRSLFAFFTSLLRDVEKIATKSVPSAGATVFQSLQMVERTVDIANREQAIENLRDLKKLKKESGLTDKEYTELMKSCDYN